MVGYEMLAQVQRDLTAEQVYIHVYIYIGHVTCLVLVFLSCDVSVPLVCRLLPSLEHCLRYTTN